MRKSVTGNFDEGWEELCSLSVGRTPASSQFEQRLMFTHTLHSNRGPTMSSMQLYVNQRKYDKPIEISTN